MDVVCIWKSVVRSCREIFDVMWLCCLYDVGCDVDYVYRILILMLFVCEVEWFFFMFCCL